MNPELLRRLPKMDLLLARPALAEHPLPYPVKRQAARQVLDDCRGPCGRGPLPPSPARRSWRAPSSAWRSGCPAPPWGG